MRAIRITEFGGPEVLTLVEDAPEPEVGPGTQLLHVTRAGINYADTHQAEDSYLAPSTLPLIPGAEAAGTLEDGRRVVALVGGGGYAERAAVPEPLTFDLPDGVEDGQALALVLQGTTAWHLLHTSAQLRTGESVVVHAAAGGVGTLAVQLAVRAGAGRVIAVASSAEKRQLALELGADVAVDAGEDDLKGALEEANGGKVDVVLEMVGGRTTDQSLAALAPFGRLVVFGMASREAPSLVDPRQLMGRSRGLIGFWLAHAMNDPARHLAAPMRELLDLTAQGALKPIVGGTYGLSEVARAHEDLRARRTIGKLLLDPAG
ncbi:MAG: NADPH:quinone oxidoreductase family protein [Nitriliruptoraceae bacterium]|nr:NADPH:quinone oxidoreductase family protein [Nitriliruptoraceae bacterium]